MQKYSEKSYTSSSERKNPPSHFKSKLEMNQLSEEGVLKTKQGFLHPSAKL